MAPIHDSDKISETQLERIDSLLRDVDSATESLPPKEREAYQEAEQSIAEARRHAERHEGLLQVY